MNTESTETQFQPAVVIVAEIAFAALLLYMSTQPADLSVGVMAQAEDKANRTPVLTISIPANVAIASTDIPNIVEAPIDSALIRTSN